MVAHFFFFGLETSTDFGLQRLVPFPILYLVNVLYGLMKYKYRVLCYCLPDGGSGLHPLILGRKVNSDHEIAHYTSVVHPTSSLAIYPGGVDGETTRLAWANGRLLTRLLTCIAPDAGPR